MLAVIGSLVAFVGAIWLIVTAIQTGQTTGDKVIWALVNFLCQPLGGIIFYIVKKQGLIPLLMVIGGWILLIAGGGMNFSFGNMP
jgi:cytochrome c oxidase assembly factor CtaG